MFARNAAAFTAFLAIVFTTAWAPKAEAFAILLDQTLAFCDEDFSSGAVSVAIGRYNFEGGTDTSAACGDPSKLDPFSVKIGNNFYDSVFLNDDGLLTFGAGHDGTLTDVTDAGFGPAIATFFRNASYESGVPSGRISWGSTSNPGIGDFLSLNYNGPTSYYQINIFNRDDIAAGDFDVQMNYTFNEFPVALGDLPGQIGFNNGAGQSYEFAGSGILGAFDGDLTECGSATVSPNALACDSLGSTVLGRYVLQFRNGVVVNLPPAMAVPEPGVLSLMLIGLGALTLRRRRTS